MLKSVDGRDHFSMFRQITTAADGCCFQQLKQNGCKGAIKKALVPTNHLKRKSAMSQP
jgi:hypothetical protein